MKKYILFIGALSTSLLSSVAIAEIEFSGFGSIVAGKTLDSTDDPFNPGQQRDEILTADFYDVGQYDNDISFNPESVFALQASSDIGEGFKITTQLVAKGTDDFEPEFDWYYLTYQATEKLSIMAGRRNIPMYYFSEFYEVGYAYPWMRPPSNLYWWQITQFNGVSAMYDFNVGEYPTTLTVFYGNERSKDNKEMGYYEVLFGGEDTTVVDEFWTDIAGFNWNISGDIFDVRLVYFQHDMERNRYLADSTSTQTLTSQRFYGFGGSIDLTPFTILFDMNLVTRDDGMGTEFPTFLVSAVYTIGEYQPYVTYSKADHKRTKSAAETDDLEQHYIMSFGLRYNFLPNAALKVQFDHFVDQGNEVTGWAYHGDSDTVTLGVDFIF